MREYRHNLSRSVGMLLKGFWRTLRAGEIGLRMICNGVGLPLTGVWRTLRAREIGFIRHFNSL